MITLEPFFDRGVKFNRPEGPGGVLLMSDHDDQDRDKMRRFPEERSGEPGQMILETERMLANTRQFLDHLAESQERSRKHL